MIKNLSRLLFCMLFVGLLSAWVTAQDSDANSKSDVRTISGCLTKSGNGNGYLLTASDGSTWDVKGNSSVDLAGNVGQQVQVKGVVSNNKAHNMKEDTKQMANDAGAKNNTAEHGHLKVTDVQKTGTSCEQ
ncbi:MAG TPA: hypothetical protein VHW45_16435 [Candidatus Sulfotelmatobacter sp.]|jgi:hypothetical protein|nr:hypothetical protein [Candidatus Sulfotelmatobacter sp.]